MIAERICGNCTMTHSPSPAQHDGNSTQGGYNQEHKAPSLSSLQCRVIISPTEGLAAVLSYLPQVCVTETVLQTKLRMYPRLYPLRNNIIHRLHSVGKMNLTEIVKSLGK